MSMLIVLGVLVVVGLIVWGAYAAAQRRKELAAWARSHGLRYSRERDRGLDDRYPEFPCLRQGSNRYAYNILQGDWRGRRFWGCDYHYETYSTNAKGHQETHHHHFSLVILRSEIPLQPLVIRPENLFDKITEFFGWDDIDFESAEFSRRFHVSAPNKRWAYDVLHPRTMEFLLGVPRYHLQFHGHDAVVWRKSTLDVAEFATAADVIAGVLDRLPPYVVQQQQQQSTVRE